MIEFTNFTKLFLYNQIRRKNLKTPEKVIEDLGFFKGFGSLEDLESVENIQFMENFEYDQYNQVCSYIIY